MWTAVLAYAAACMVIGVLAVTGEWLAEAWRLRKRGDRDLLVTSRIETDRRRKPDGV
jgi:hypothetical protein